MLSWQGSDGSQFKANRWVGLTWPAMVWYILVINRMWCSAQIRRYFTSQNERSGIDLPRGVLGRCGSLRGLAHKNFTTSRSNSMCSAPHFNRLCRLWMSPGSTADHGPDLMSLPMASLLGVASMTIDGAYCGFPGRERYEKCRDSRLGGENECLRSDAQ